MKPDAYELTRSLEETYWWFVARRAIVFDQMQQTLDAGRKEKSDNRPLRLMDFGCGTGGTLASLAKIGDAFGMDASETALRFCGERGIQNLFKIDPEKALSTENPFGDNFDAILMLDVLEHVDDDIGLVRTLGSWLKPDGSLLIAVPAYEWLWSGEDYISNHLRRYTRKSLRNVVLQAGLQVDKITCFNFWLFPLQVLTILMNRIFYPRSMYESVLKPLPYGINRFLSRVMESEKRFLRFGMFPFGGSILCRCRVRNYTKVSG